MRFKYSKDEIIALIKQLSNPINTVSENALTNLLMAPRRTKIPLLINAIPKGDPLTKQKICFILGGTDDKRCIEPLINLLEDESENVRLAAIEALQHFGEPNIIPHLSKQLSSQSSAIKEQTILALANLLKYGIQQAADPLIKKVKDENEDEKLRLLALRNLSYLDPEKLKVLINELSTLSSAVLYAEIIHLQDELEDSKSESYQKRINKLIDEIIFVEADPLQEIRLRERLMDYGPQAMDMILERLIDDVENTKLFVLTTLTVSEFGNRSIHSLKKLFESYDDFDNVKANIIVSHLLISLEEDLLERLADSFIILLHKINKYIHEKDTKKRAEKFYMFKSEIHEALARAGRTDAIDDLKELVGDGTKRRLYRPLLNAVKLIGDREFLIPLINLHNIEIFEEDKKLLKRAFRSILRREKIKKDDELFQNLSKDQKKVLELYL